VGHIRPTAVSRLNDAVPPTLPDRSQLASLRETIHIDTKTKLRVNDACASIGSSTAIIEIARLRAHLAAWLPADLAEKSRAVDWHDDCSARHSSAMSSAICGVERESLVRATTANAKLGTDPVKLTLSAVDANGNVYWLLDGVTLKISRGLKISNSQSAKIIAIT